MVNVQTRSTFLTLTFVCTPIVASGATINVPADQSTIQDGIDAATSGVDEVVVGPGTYAEKIDFDGKAIAVRSSGGASVTTIDGTGQGDSVVRCDNGEAADSILEGFTITGGSALFGGGMINDGTSPTVRNCIFVDNSASLFGGGMYNLNGGSPTVTECLFLGNTANSNGGGMHSFSSTVTLINCVFSGNSATNNGGGLYIESVNPSTTNCTFSGNTAGVGGGIYNSASNPTIDNCILWGNSDGGGMDESGQIHVLTGTPVVNFSDVQGAWTGSGSSNLSVDPLFVDADGADNTIGTADDNTRLGPGSLCANAGDNGAVTASTDLDGNARIMGGTVDMGPYETVEASGTVPADRDEDGDVDGVDFSTFASCFNKAGNPPRTLGCDPDDQDAFDFDDDGDVDGVDFSAFASCFNKAGNPPRTLGCPQN